MGRKVYLGIWGLIFLLIFTGCTGKEFTPEVISEERLQTHMAYLNSEELQGRRFGTEGNERAVTYVAQYFQELGLDPFPGGQYQFPFEAATFQWTGVPSLALLSPQGDVVARYEMGKDFIVDLDHVSQGGHFKGPMMPIITGQELITTNNIFQGYGVLIDFESPEVQKFQMSEEALSDRLVSEKASAILYRDTDLFQGTDLGSKNTFLSPRGLLKIGVKEEIYDALWEYSTQGYLVEIDVPVTFSLTQGDNVYGVIPGSNPNYQDYILVSAFIDGLGQDPWGNIQPGPRDNSGAMALMLELARTLKEGNYQGESTIIFAAFNGRYTGNIGVGQYFYQSPYSTEQTRAIVLDQLGRQKDPLLIGTYINPRVKFPNARRMLTDLIRGAERINLPFESSKEYLDASYSIFRTNGMIATVLTGVTGNGVEALSLPQTVDYGALMDTGQLVLAFIQEQAFAHPFKELADTLLSSLPLWILWGALVFYKAYWLKNHPPGKNTLGQWILNHQVLTYYGLFSLLSTILIWQGRYDQWVDKGGGDPVALGFSWRYYILALLRNIFSSAQMLSLTMFVLLVSIFLLVLCLHWASMKLKRKGYLPLLALGTVFLYDHFMENFFSYRFTALWPQLISYQGIHGWIIVLMGILALLFTYLHAREGKVKNDLFPSLFFIASFLVLITFVYSPYILDKSVFDLRVTGGVLKF